MQYLTQCQQQDEGHLQEYLAEEGDRNALEIFTLANDFAARFLTRLDLKRAEFLIESALIFGQKVPDTFKGLLYQNISSLFELKGDSQKAKLYHKHSTEMLAK